MPPGRMPSRAVYVRRRLAVGLVGVALVGGVVAGAGALDGDGRDSVSFASTSNAPHASSTIATRDTSSPASPASAATIAVAATPTATASAATAASAPAATAPAAPVTPTVAGTSPASTTVASTAAITEVPPAAPTAVTGTRVGLATDPTAPVVHAAAYGVYDLTAGTWLTATNADARRPVGSIMKLLTAHVVMQAGDPSKVVTVPALALGPMESAIGLYAGETLPRDVLLRAMLIVSANDAAEALAVDVGGTRDGFVEMMNDAARDLGLADTIAANPSGLDGGGAVSTVRDAVTLAAELMRDGTFRATVTRTSARLHGQTFPTTNDLLGTYAGADGIKTGSTTQAGFGVVASATRDDRTLLVAVLGALTDGARFEHAAMLLDWGFGRA